VPIPVEILVQPFNEAPRIRPAIVRHIYHGEARALLLLVTRFWMNHDEIPFLHGSLPYIKYMLPGS